MKQEQDDSPITADDVIELTKDLKKGYKQPNYTFNDFIIDESIQYFRQFITIESFDLIYSNDFNSPYDVVVNVVVIFDGKKFSVSIQGLNQSHGFLNLKAKPSASLLIDKLGGNEIAQLLILYLAEESGALGA